MINWNVIKISIINNFLKLRSIQQFSTTVFLKFNQNSNKYTENNIDPDIKFSNEDREKLLSDLDTLTDIVKSDINIEEFIYSRINFAKWRNFKELEKYIFYSVWA